MQTLLVVKEFQRIMREIVTKKFNIIVDNIKKNIGTPPSLPNFRFFFPLDCFGAEFDADGLLSLFFHRMPNMSVYKKKSTYKTRRNEKFRPPVRKRAHCHSLIYQSHYINTEKILNFLFKKLLF